MHIYGFINVQVTKDVKIRRRNAGGLARAEGLSYVVEVIRPALTSVRSNRPLSNKSLYIP